MELYQTRLNVGPEERISMATLSGNKTEARARRPLVLPGAWAMGEGLIVDDDFSTSTECCSSTAYSAAFHGGLSQMAESWTTSVGHYFAGIASVFVKDARAGENYLGDECTADPDFCSCVVTLSPGSSARQASKPSRPRMPAPPAGRKKTD